MSRGDIFHLCLWGDTTKYINPKQTFPNPKQVVIVSKPTQSFQHIHGLQRCTAPTFILAFGFELAYFPKCQNSKCRFLNVYHSIWAPEIHDT